jgi:hypothetical protein
MKSSTMDAPRPRMVPGTARRSAKNQANQNHWKARQGGVQGPRRRKRPIITWLWCEPGDQDVRTVLAYTRSEARSLVKKALGLGSHHRMPSQIRLWRGETTVGQECVRRLGNLAVGPSPLSRVAGHIRRSAAVLRHLFAVSPETRRAA